jgi:hypothetical protein
LSGTYRRWIIANLDQMISRVRHLVGNHSIATEDLISSFVNERHQILFESHEWSRKKQEIILATTADADSGTLSVTNGASTITGTSTAFASTDVGSYIKIGSDESLYVVNAVTSSTSLTLGDLNGTVIGYAGATASSLSYVLFKRFYSLGSGIDQITSVKYKRRLREVDQTFIDRLDPPRTSTGDPLYFARGPWDQSGTKDEVRVEFYPRSSTAIAINVDVQLAHTDLSVTQNPIVPSAPLEWYAAEDTCYVLYARTKEEKWLKLADKYMAQGNISLERAKNEDSKRFGVSQQVKDIAGGVGLTETDFALNKDLGIY